MEKPQGVGEERTSYDSYDAYSFCIDDRKENPEEYKDMDEKEFLQIVADSDYDNYHSMLYVLNQMVEEVRSPSHWHCEVINHGWQGKDGYKYFYARDAQNVLWAIFDSGTENSFTIYEYIQPKTLTCGIALSNANHDAPRGDEWYLLTPKE